MSLEDSCRILLALCGKRSGAVLYPDPAGGAKRLVTLEAAIDRKAAALVAPGPRNGRGYQARAEAHEVADLQIRARDRDN